MRIVIFWTVFHLFLRYTNILYIILLGADYLTLHEGEDHVCTSVLAL